MKPPRLSRTETMARISTEQLSLQEIGPNVVRHPKIVYQAFLNEMTRCNMTGDFHTWADMNEYPCTIHTDNLDTVANSPSDIRGFFLMVRDMLTELDVDDFDRRAEHAEYVHPTMIVGHHMVFMRSKGRNVIEPMASRITLRNITGAWRIISITNSIANSTYPYWRPLPSDGLLPDLNIRQRSMNLMSGRRFAGKQDPLPIYSAFLEELSDAISSGDFERWCDLHTLPATSHTATADYTIRTRDDLRSIFDCVRQLETRRTRDIPRREATYAEWASETQIRGYHMSIYDDTADAGGTSSNKTRFTLKLKDGAWRLCAVMNSEMVTEVPGLTPDKLHLPEETEERSEP